MSEAVVKDIASRGKRKKPAEIKVWLTEKPPVTHDLADDKDWSVVFDDVLEIKTPEGEAFYYPLTNVDKWTVKCV